MRLMFLHGAGLTRAMWSRQLSDLSDEFEVTAIDLPGHGERSGERFTFDGAVARVKEALGDERAVLVGLSLGGFVAMATAAAHPRSAAGLVLTGCSVDYSRLGYRLQAKANAGLMRIWPKRLLQKAHDTSLRRAYGDEADPVIEGGNHWRGYVDALVAAPRTHWHGVLETYEGPVLILNGEDDRPSSKEQDRLLPRLRHGRVEAIAGAGHLANLDQPEAYTAAVRRFARLAA